MRELDMSSTGKDPAKVNNAPGQEEEESEDLLDDHLADWAEEDREMEDRKPDLGEIEEDTSEL
jgi:hypothetical protein